MILSKENIKYIKKNQDITIPDNDLFNLPEKVLQFGTGVLLRGLPDYFIDKANRRQIFNGRIVVVKSTDKGDTIAFNAQNGLYTLCVRGVEQGSIIAKDHINSAISRVLSGNTQWAEILATASSPDMKVIISNTTELGIQYEDDDIKAKPPVSFPGKLLAYLYSRYRHFNGADEAGMIIIPTELIEDNATQLLSILIRLANDHNLEKEFLHWLKHANHFCNSLVDRIVPGTLPRDESHALQEKYGYEDSLMIMAESFRLWAIESDSHHVKKILSFATADTGVVIFPSIKKFRELKLRLLNGTHSFCCALALLNGNNTVIDSMNDPLLAEYIYRLMISEIAPSMDASIISIKESQQFAVTVMDRFRNPFIEHKWSSISVNYTQKMKLRTIPLISRHYENTKDVPSLMALGFAAFLLFMRAEKSASGIYFTDINDKKFVIEDPAAEIINNYWMTCDRSSVVKAILADQMLWGCDLNACDGFTDSVEKYLYTLEIHGSAKLLQELLT